MDGAQPVVGQRIDIESFAGRLQAFAQVLAQLVLVDAFDAARDDGEAFAVTQFGNDLWRLRLADRGGHRVGIAAARRAKGEGEHGHLQALLRSLGCYGIR
ncbi:hypothetical protein D3C72_983560 [compost metagenome]